MARRSPVLAALLTFLWPGAGHAYFGRTRAAVVFALPVALAVVALGLTALGGINHLIVSAITPSGAFTVLVLLVLTGVWRLLALADVAALARREDGRLRLRAFASTGLLFAMTMAMHAAGAYAAYAAYDASSRIFVMAGVDAPSPDAILPGGAAASPIDNEYLATPLATPGSTGRVTILLTGIDSAETRTTSLTDTMLVVSLNPADGTVVMLSVPRDIAGFPLYNGETYAGKINSLMTWARLHPAAFPDGPLPTLIREIGYLIGTPIHYYAAVDLAGFRHLIDEIGGVTVVNDRAIDDPRYDWLDGTHGFTLPAGAVTLDGRTALAFVRSRQGDGDSDFTRARRQQELLLAIRAKLTTAAMLPNLPDIIRAAGDTIRTNVPPERLDGLLALAEALDASRLTQIVLGPPYAIHPPTDATGGTYVLRLDMDKVRAESVTLFGVDSAFSVP
jgi:LCP family protein required for cell wall assembly